MRTAAIQYNNHVDSLQCVLNNGTKVMKLLHNDSRLRIITRTQGVLHYYANTVYIWKNEFLIGERSSITWSGNLYLPIRLSDIIRIEVRAGKHL